MSITDELRKWGYGFCGDTHDVVNSIADHIDAEHKKQVTDAFTKGAIDGINMAEHSIEYVKLPVDADGVPIHVGDVMDGTCPSGKHVNGTVNAIGDGVFWLSNVQFSLKPNYMHHHHAPTVEDVLREFFARYVTTKPKDEDDAILAEYAAKLRLAGDAK